MMNNSDDEKKALDEERRREAWIGLLGAAFLGAFLLIFFQGSLLQGAQSIFASPTSSVAQTSSGASSQGVAALPVAGSLTQTVQTPVANSQITSTVSVPTAPPTTTIEGSLIVLFTGGPVAVKTAQSYSGPVTITVSGTGQAQGTIHSDAFYIYTDANGNTVAPTHHSYTSLCVNGQRVDHLVRAIPSYNPNHIYKLTFTAPGGPLTFGVCDTILTDNTGSFTIKFS